VFFQEWISMPLYTHMVASLVFPLGAIVSSSYVCVSLRTTLGFVLLAWTWVISLSLSLSLFLLFPPLLSASSRRPCPMPSNRSTYFVVAFT